MFSIYKLCIALCMMVYVGCSLAEQPGFWKGTPLDSSVEEMRALCSNDDAIACLKYKFVSFLDTLYKKDSFKLFENIEVNRNNFRSNEVSARSDTPLENDVQNYLQSHDVTFKLPVGESSVTVEARNLDKDELDFKLRFSDGENEPQARKSKLKKIIVPILVFVLLKAITLIPLALGVLGLKAWNALQLSFFSFVVAISLAVFQLCKKIAADSSHAPIAAHGPWDSAYSNHYARSFEVQDVAGNLEAAQNIAYSAYV